MRVPTSLLLADAASEAAGLVPGRQDYAIAIGALFLVALIPNFVAAKVLAEERGTIPRVLAALLCQVLAGGIILGVTVSVALAPSVRLPLVISICLALLTLATARIYGFGIAKGSLYTLGTAAVMWGIFQAIIVAFNPMPLQRVLYSLTTQAESAKQVRKAAAAGEGQPDSTPGMPTPADSAPAAAEGSPAPKFETEAEARAAAVKKYPALAVPGSDFNRRFVELHTQFKTTMPAVLAKPEWPMVLADEVAKELGKK
jgi:hypothetical protein